MSDMQNMTVREALLWLKPRIRFGYLAGRIGFDQSMFTQTIHGVNRGYPFRLTAEREEQLRSEVALLAQRLFATRISDDVTYEWNQPLSHGDTALKQLKQLNTVIRLKNILQEYGGMTLIHLHKTISDTTYCRYGRFTEEELQKINSAIRQFALQVANVNIIKSDC